MSRLLIPTLTIAAILHTIAWVLGSPYFDFGGEAVSIAPFLNAAFGRPPFGIWGEIPFATSPYSHLFYWLFWPLSWFQSVEWMGGLGRLLIAGIVFLIGRSLYQFGKSNFDDNWKPIAFATFSSWVAFIYIEYLLSIRVDFIAFGLEWLGFLAFYQFNKGKKRKTKLLIHAGIFLGLASAFKLNTVGVAMGCGTLLLFHKRFKDFGILLFAFFATLGMAALSGYLVYGKGLFLEVYALAFFPTGDLESFVERFYEIVASFIIGVSVIAIAAVVGLMHIRDRSKREFETFIFPLLASFLIGTFTMAQHRGAPNFLYGFHFLLIVLSTVGFSIVLKSRSPLAKAQTLFYFVVPAVLFILAIEYDLRAFYRAHLHPYDRISDFLEKSYPDERVYIPNDPNAAVWLFEKAAFGPYIENYFNQHPYYKKSLPLFRDAFLKEKIRVEIREGPNCGSDGYRGLFEDVMGSRKELVKRDGNICVFEYK